MKRISAVFAMILGLGCYENPYAPQGAGYPQGDEYAAAPSKADCRRIASAPQSAPEWAYQQCMHVYPGLGMGGRQPVPDVVITTPYEAAGVRSGGGGVEVIPSTMPAIAPNSGNTVSSAPSGDDYATKEDVRAVAEAVADHDLEICKLKKTVNCK